MNAEIKNKISECGLPIVIYGASTVGEVLADELARNNIQVSVFCDYNINKAGKYFCGKEVIHISQLKERYPRAFFIISAAEIIEVRKKLEESGYFDYMSGSAILEEINVYERDYGKPSEFVEYTVSTCINCHKNLLEKESLFARSIDFIITQKCSLKCRDCSNLAQYYKNPENFEEKKLYKEIDRLCSLFDQINEIRLIGGEPFMHPKACEIANYLAGKKVIGKVVIFSNGTLPFNENMTSLLKDPKILILFSDYGNALSRNLSKNEEICMAEDIAFLTTKLEGWVDCCSMAPHGGSAQEIRQKFMECCSKNVFSAAQGKLYRCPFLANAFQLKGIPDRKEDYLDFMEETIDTNEMKEKIKNFLFFKDNMLSCDFCNGRPLTAPADVEPAVQLKEAVEYGSY